MFAHSARHWPARAFPPFSLWKMGNPHSLGHLEGWIEQFLLGLSQEKLFFGVNSSQSGLCGGEWNRALRVCSCPSPAPPDVSTGSFLLIKSCISQLSPGKSAANKDEEIIRLFLPRLCSLGIALLWDPFVFPTQFQALVIYIGFKSILHRWKLYCPKFIQQSRLSLALEWRFLVRKKQLNQLFFGQMCYTHRDSP